MLLKSIAWGLCGDTLNERSTRLIGYGPNYQVSLFLKLRLGGLCGDRPSGRSTQLIGNRLISLIGINVSNFK